MDENAQQTAPEKTSSNQTLYILVAVVILLIIAGGGFYLYKKSSNQAAQTQQQSMQPTQAMQVTSAPTKTQSSGETPTTASSEATTNATIQKITITGSNFTFDPKTITVKKGQPVALTFKNTNGAHDLVIDAFNVKTPIISTGQSTTVTFTPDKTGSFPYYCSVANHRAMGMEGTIVVE